MLGEMRAFSIFAEVGSVQAAAARLCLIAAELGPLAPIAIVRLAERADWSSAMVAAAAARVKAANPSLDAAALLPGRLPS